GFGASESTAAAPSAAATTAAAAAATSAAAAEARGDHVARKHEDVEPAGEAARVQRLRVHDLERELELLEQPARPAGGHRPAVAIREADPELAQLRDVAGGRRSDRFDADAEIRGELLDDRARGRTRRDVERSLLRPALHPRA